MTQWNEIEKFKYIDLNDSFVIGWKCCEDIFYIDLEASLLPGHKDYITPNKDEYTCYKLARLLFLNLKNMSGLLSIENVEPNNVMDGEIADYDEIEYFKVGEKEFHLIGKFGDVTFSAREWEFKIAH